MTDKTGSDNPANKSKGLFDEYDADTVERVHQENIRKSLLASEKARSEHGDWRGMSRPTQYTWKTGPRKVSDDEISPYQGTGGKHQMQRAQSRKRRQVRRREASIWDDLAPKEVHWLLNLMFWVILILGLGLAFVLSGRL